MVVRKILFIVLIIIIAKSLCLSQAIDFSSFKGKPVNVVMVYNMQDPYYLVYDTSFRIINTSSSDMRTVENLLVSIYSATDLTSYNSNFKNGKEYPILNDDIKRRTTSDTLFNHFLPVHKLQYTDVSGQHAVVKYWEIINGKKDKLYSLHAIKSGDSWQILNINSNEDIDYLIRAIKPDAFKSLKTSSQPKDEFLKDIFEKTRTEMRVLNISKLVALIREWDEKNYTDRLNLITDL